MEELSKNIKKDKIEELYDTYVRIKNIMDELNKNIKELPPKEEL